MSRDARDPDEARRILERIERESGAFHESLTVKASRRVRGHLEARDVDQDDAIEVWGTRIGRVLGAILFAALVLWLVLWLTGAQ